MKRVWLAGEGKHELGGRLGVGAWQDGEPGVVEALLERVSETESWTVVGASKWASARKLQVGAGLPAKQRRRATSALQDDSRRIRGDGLNLRKIALEAQLRGADVLVFVRDQDGDADRQSAIDEARSVLAARMTMRVAGGLAVRDLDGWCLAFGGQRKSEMRKDAKSELAAQGVSSTVDRVERVVGSDLEQLPEDARSLRAWLDDVRDALA